MDVDEKILRLSRVYNAYIEDTGVSTEFYLLNVNVSSLVRTVGVIELITKVENMPKGDLIDVLYVSENVLFYFYFILRLT